VRFFDGFVKEENGIKGRFFRHFHILRKAFEKRHKTKNKIAFLLVKADGF